MTQPEILLKGRQRDVHGRGAEDHHELRQAHRSKKQPTCLTLTGLRSGTGRLRQLRCFSQDRMRRLGTGRGHHHAVLPLGPHLRTLPCARGVEPLAYVFVEVLHADSAVGVAVRLAGAQPLDNGTGEAGRFRIEFAEVVAFPRVLGSVGRGQHRATVSG